MTDLTDLSLLEAAGALRAGEVSSRELTLACLDRIESLDIFSVHGFPVGLIQCESNFLGIMEPGRYRCVGSGGWANIIEKFKKAKA